ncbi:hypothetical protein CAB17_02550 [Legionella sainthelensi]|uniref:Uncharacterized protein n=1 Tax=Legionella sainthelensi TaxID=28087 RepID=A0A2H5FHN0_9GAMM|nr:hypothetical protein CAB17_02550 [Legionella sainthelensi]
MLRERKVFISWNVQGHLKWKQVYFNWFYLTLYSKYVGFGCQKMTWGFIVHQISSQIDNNTDQVVRLRRLNCHQTLAIF